mgnify:CR=1 FL=1
MNKKPKEMPVYLFTGFLESGKTKFIQETLEDKRFCNKEKTLLLVCEEGEEEYAPEQFATDTVVIRVIEGQEQLTTENLTKWAQETKADRVVIEYNGMWNFKNMKLPWYWKVEQQITTIDGSTFPMYYTNMKSLLAEMIRKSEMIIFNRCDGIQDLNVYKRNIKAVNPAADVIFEDSNGEIDEIFEEDLPYDLNQDPIVLDNQGYGIWYLDSMDHLERYEGKNIQFLAMVLKPEEYPDGYFVPGRMAMTCCAEDMAFLGYACEFAGTKDLKQKEWVKVTAKVAREYFADYKGEGPVLHAISVEKAKAPKDPVISFN